MKNIDFIKKKKIRFLINNAAYSNRGKFFPYNHKNLNEELWGTLQDPCF